MIPVQEIEEIWGAGLLDHWPSTHYGLHGMLAGDLSGCWHEADPLGGLRRGPPHGLLELHLGDHSIMIPVQEIEEIWGAGLLAHLTGLFHERVLR